MHFIYVQVYGHLYKVVAASIRSSSISRSSSLILSFGFVAEETRSMIFIFSFCGRGFMALSWLWSLTEIMGLKAR